MSSTAVLKSLGYDQSPNYLDMVGDAVPSSSPFSHIYRQAIKDCGLQGVYIINENVDGGQRSVKVPVVFHCKAKDEKEARHFHRLVWNQNIAPLVLVETRSKFHLYCGFRFSGDPQKEKSNGIINASSAFNEAIECLKSISASSIDSGKIWSDLGNEITTETRVDWKLLKNLNELDTELQKKNLNRKYSHALIGKFVYLKYLRDRDILSNDLLEEWGIVPDDIFSPKAKVTKFKKLNKHLHTWLNGGIFPLEINAIRSSHLQIIANVFSGGSSQGQLHLDFQAYDFSFIPIETLSIIYEQFLHSPELGKESKGKKEGAYYTPLPLVNYTLNELENRRPLKEGMKVLDPSCGSGAFLVQCYRALIEKKRVESNKRPNPSELRELLVKHVYGVDRDGDACQVAEMSLILTLLDYTEPRDLFPTDNFKLPKLRNKNIFKADFFDPDSRWTKESESLKFDWLVGNPPWSKYSDLDQNDQHVRNWAAENSGSCPIGGKQIAEAFVWHAMTLLNEDADAGLVLPAMSLFNSHSGKFRKKLFKEIRAWGVTNFANIRSSLFSGRSTHPAMTLFFTPVNEQKSGSEDNDKILTFTPFAVNQRANRHLSKSSKKGTWSIVVNGSELSEISQTEAASGNIEPWKLAMWGTFRDRKLLQRIKKRFPPFTDFLQEHELEGPTKGLPLPDLTKIKNTTKIEPLPEIVGKLKIDPKGLKGYKHIFDFPVEALLEINENDAYRRIQGGLKGLKVAQPPHIFLDASRRFAIYSDQFLVILHPHFGIIGPKNKKNILKALSIYLNSDFFTYQEFFASSEWGIRATRPTITECISLPVPLDELTEKEIKEWADFQDELTCNGTNGQTVSNKLIHEMNQKVIKLLGLRDQERILIEDFVHVNMKMIDGQIPDEITKSPDDTIIYEYLNTLKNELNLFMGENSGIRHTVDLLKDDISAIVAVALTNGEDRAPVIYYADDPAAESLAKTRENLIKKQSQWLYFARDLRVYSDNTLYMLKPMEQIQWTKRQAIIDAGEVIAETIGQQNTS